MFARFKRWISRLAARFSLIVSWAIPFSGSVVVLTYHKVIPSLDRVIARNAYVSIRAFEDQLKYLIRKKYKFLSINEFLELVNSKKCPSRNSVLLTFDDGSTDSYKYVFPILKRYQLPAVFFLPTEYIGSNKTFWWDRLEALLQQTEKEDILLEINAVKRRILLRGKRNKIKAYNIINKLVFGNGKQISNDHDAEAIFKVLESALGNKKYSYMPSTMQWDNALEIYKAGYKVGAHTKNHCSLPDVEKPIAYEEIEKSKQVLQQKLGENICFFAYPYGYYNDSIIRMLKDLGFKLAFGLKEGHVNLKNEPFAIERVTIGAEVDMLLFKAKMNPYYQGIIERLSYLGGFLGYAS